jgi:redox-sensing transcriptional repressor
LVSRKTIARMSQYRRLLIALRDAGVTHVFSHQLAKLANVTAAQVRRDFMAIGYTGSPTRGYETDQCIEAVVNFLDGPSRQEVALVGAGKLGRSVVAHFAGRRPMLSIVAAFDNDIAKVGLTIDGCRCYHVDDMERVVRRKAIQIAIVATPREAAQQAIDRLVACGVRSIVNFASVPLHVPDDVTVIDMDITAALESAAYFARESAEIVPEREPIGEGEPDAKPVLKQLDALLAGNRVPVERLASGIGAQLLTKSTGSCEICKIYAGDRVSDLLNEASDKTLLVTNLMSEQLIRLAELMDVPAICFVNGTRPEAGLIKRADDSGTILLVSPIGVFETCGRIYQTLAPAPQA